VRKTAFQYTLVWEALGPMSEIAPTAEHGPPFGHGCANPIPDRWWDFLN